MSAYDLWAPRRRVERNYAWAIARLIRRRTEILSKVTTPEEYLKALRDYALSELFRQDAYGLAGKMVTQLFHDGERSWRAAARKGSRGREIYEMLQKELSGGIGYAYHDTIRNNAQYITTLPDTLAKISTGIAARAQTQGKRPEEVVRYMLAAFPDMTKTHAQLIARTEISKASTALTRARSEECGFDWYIWRTADDGNRVRDSHQLMEDVLVRWSDPPSPERLNREKREYGAYHAGETFNCRCHPEPLIELHYTTWPHKVYYGGRIQTMTRRQFERIAA